MNDLPLFSTKADEEIQALRKRIAELEGEQQVKTIEAAIEYANKHAKDNNHWVRLIEEFADRIRKWG